MDPNDHGITDEQAALAEARAFFERVHNDPQLHMIVHHAITFYARGLMDGQNRPALSLPLSFPEALKRAEEVIEQDSRASRAHAVAMAELFRRMPMIPDAYGMHGAGKPPGSL